MTALEHQTKGLLHIRILVLGGGGFIGRHLIAELNASGHEIVVVARTSRGLEEALRGVSVVAMDLAEAIRPRDWTTILHGIDVVVNSAGVLRGKDMWRVHVEMPRALHAAAQDVGVERIVLLSAISARADVATDYAQSKLQGEAELRRSALRWTILRPSLVYGDGSYGGTSLMRGMAGLPGVLPVPGKGDFAFTPIHVRDLALAVRCVCGEPRFVGRTLEPVGPETVDLKAMLTRYRAWLGFGAARTLRVPMPVMRVVARIGDIAGSGPVASNSLTQLVVGNAGDSAAFADEIGFAPRSLTAALAERPAQVQDRWHARLFFLEPAIRAVLVFLWVVSGILGLTTGGASARVLVALLGGPASLADPLRIGSSLLDLAIAALVLTDTTARRSTPAQIVTVLGYSLVLGVAMPALWVDPLGPLLKNLPILALILVHGAIGDRR